MLSGTVTSPNLESIPCTFEIPESASNAVEPIGNQADFSHRKGPVCEQQLLEGASIIERNRPEASLEAQPRQLFLKDSDSTGLDSAHNELHDNDTATRLLHRNRTDLPSGFIVSKDPEDEVSTTQATTASTALSQRDANPQSQSSLLTADQRSIDPMSEVNPSGSPERASRPSSESGGPVRMGFRERVKALRAASRANENSPASSFGQPPGQSPTNAPLRHQEPAPTTRPAERRSSQVPIQSPPASSLTDLQPTVPPPVINQKPISTNGIPPPQQSPQQQSSFLPQPQAHVTPEQQTRLMVRPMAAVPVGVPLAVRTSPNGPPADTRPSHATSFPEPSYLPKTASLTPFGLVANEHTIGLAMPARVRDQYTSIINLFRTSIEDLMNSDLPTEAVIQDARKLLARVNYITTHQDLDTPESLEESQTSAEDEATWAEECSFKFKFLNHLFVIMRNDAAQISIVARPGRTLDMIEKFLKGRGVRFYRPDGRGSSLPNDPRIAGCRLEVTIIPSGPVGMYLAVRHPTLVIAFDDSFNVRDHQVLQMRVQPNLGWDVPAVHLLVYKSAEHIARCVEPQMDEVARLKKIISCMTQLRHEVGILPPEDTPAGAAAEEVAIALRLNGHPLKWALPPIRAIPLDLVESSQDASTQDGSQSSDLDAPRRNPALKRSWKPESSNTEAVKRQRMSPTGNVSHISDSATQSSQAQIDHLQRQNAYLTRQNNTLRSQIEHSNAAFANLKENLTATTRTNHSLSSQLSHHTTQESHLSDLEASLSDLQTRYEDTIRSHAHIHHEKTDVASDLEKATAKLAALAAESVALKESKKTLQSHLEQARQDLLATSDPDLARLAAAEAATRVAEKERAALAGKVTSLTSDLEFTRQAYQDASTSAADLAAQVAALSTQLETAEREARGEAAKLAAVNRDNAVAEARKQVRQLKVALEERDKVCRRKEEEIETLKGRRGRGGGVVTRGGSVQPGGVAGQGKSPRGSRGGSPMAGVAPGVGGSGVGGEGMRRGGSGLRGEVVG
ncbi:MAG: hypothetical protein LQ344_006673 [Seirophora lacunosa]|nr:MAG: hypothetical protein LQ344_006673 [Seirophora lacunosa]